MLKVNIQWILKDVQLTKLMKEKTFITGC